MRSIILAVILGGTLADSAWSEQVEVRELRLAADGIDTLVVDTGAGSLEIVGDAGIAEIHVEARITVPGDDAEKARERIERDFVLTLERAGASAVLESSFEHGMSWFGDAPSLALTVRLPARLGVEVDDGSGSLGIRDVDGPVTIEDGSGSLHVSGGDDVVIEDGSGSIEVRGSRGDVRVTDGSGSIRIEGVGGSVYVDDGSGSITVRDVVGDFVIEDDGSGGVSHSEIRGTVTLDE